MKQKTPESGSGPTASGSRGGLGRAERAHARSMLLTHDETVAAAAAPQLELAATCVALLLAQRSDPDRLGSAFAKLAPQLDLDAFVTFRAVGSTLRTDTAAGFALDECAGLGAELAPVAAGLLPQAQQSVAVAQHGATRQLAAELGASGFVGGIATALVRDGQLCGALLLASRTRSRFGAAELRLADVLGSCLAATERAPNETAGDTTSSIVTKNEFLTVLAHELRNPLASVRNALEILRANDRQPTAVARSAHAMIERQLEQIAWLADDLLDANQALLEQVVLDKKRVSLAGIVERAAAQSRSWLEASRHELTVEMPREPIEVDADPRRLARVFANLVNHAARHMGRGGRIGIKAELAGDNAVVTLRASANPSAASNLQALFAMGEREAVLDGRAQGGFTAGVALVKHFVELHGGTIAARGTAERGIEFVVTLPKAMGVPKRAEPALGPAPARSGPQRILVADDNADSAESTGMLLRLMGNDVRIASDGLEAVEQAETFQPDVVLLDIGMPRLDGYEAARRIRARQWSRDTLLVAVTGWGPRDDAAKAAAAGFDLHFTKPLDPAELRRLVTEQRRTH